MSDEIEDPVGAAINCNRPMLFATDDEVFPICQIGTCFVIRYRSQHWIVTAYHVLVNCGFNPVQLLVPVTVGNNESFPLRDPIKFADHNAGDSDCTDVLVFNIDSKFEVDSRSCYNVDAEPDEFKYGPDHRLMVFGFPSPLNPVDYDEQALYQERLGIAAQTVGLSKSADGCHEIQLLSNGNIETFNGFSGSPVFVVGDPSRRPVRSSLVGVVLRGSVESLKMHVLNHSAIRLLIDSYLKLKAGAHT